MKNSKSLITFILIMIFFFENSFAFDCEFQELWELIIKSDIIVLGTISSVSKSEYVFDLMDIIEGNIGQKEFLTIYKGIEPNDTIQGYVPIRFQNYTVGEKLLLFLKTDTRNNMLRNMGCYFEGELIFFNDSVSFSILRSDSNTHCRNCKIFNYDTLKCAIKNIKQLYSFKNGLGYQMKSKFEEKEFKNFDKLTTGIINEIRAFQKQQEEFKKDEDKRHFKNGLFTVIPIALTLILMPLILKLK
jgi:hypothetical protein